MFEYKCDACGRWEDRFFATMAERDKYETEGARPCKPGANLNNRKCMGKLRRQLAAPSFKVNGYCAANGYEFNGTQSVGSKNKGVQ